MSDKEVIGTGDSAAETKLSAVRVGYWVDPYLDLFALGPSANRRAAPIMHRGYYARVFAFDHAVQSFTEFWGRQGRVQVVSLGCGLDTTYLRLKDAGRAPSLFVDVDFPSVCERKAGVIRSSPRLQHLCPPHPKPLPPHVHFLSDEYAIVGADLRDKDTLAANLAAAGLSFDTPTLFVCECVLVYLEAAQADCLLGWMAHSFKASGFVGYDPVQPDDSFGRLMVDNFQKRGCPLLGITQYPTVQSHEARLKQQGFAAAEAVSMIAYYNTRIPQSEKMRVNRLEMLDEFEEWTIMLGHYCMYSASSHPDCVLFPAPTPVPGVRKLDAS